MGQIVKRKKKGRPSKADLARRRSGGGLASSESEPRRSLRRRNARYNIDYDDFLDEDDDDDDEDEEDDERGREKKLKLVVKLNQGRDGENLSPVAGLSRSGVRGEHASEYGSSASEEEDEPERKPLKKRRIGSGEEEDEDEDYEEQIRGDENEDEDIDEERGRKVVGSKGSDSVPGTPSDRSSGLPLPDKKTLELILDKLQKKDTYGVYAEPVDPEELPDYFDVIEHPMDFATVRNKLASGSYSTLEQFESDVFLICSNAMQYNSSETIYHKQARSIQELAKKKFERVRIEVERSEKELKLEQQSAKSNSLFKKQPPKKPFFRTFQEPIESDFSSGATLAATGDVQNSSNPMQSAKCEVPNNIDGQVEGCFSIFDSSNQDRAEELFSGKGLIGKLGRKTSLFDDNRRATYNVSNSPAPRSESIFSTFEDEIRQLVAVGLHAEYSYARSLARFSATLGPIAWKVASQRIEQAIPVGCKFGQGWVGEYEPLPTPVLMFENHQKELGPFSNLHSTSELRKDGKPSDTFLPKKEHHSLSGPNTEVNGLARESTLEGKPSFFRSGTPSPGLSPRQNLQTKHRNEGEKVKKQVELNSLPSPKQNIVDLGVEKQLPANPNMTASRSRDMASVNLNLVQSAPFKLPSVNGVVTGGLPNGILQSNCLNSLRAAFPSSCLPCQTVPVSASHGQDLGPGKPVQLMRMISERAPKQESSCNQSSSNSPRALSSAASTLRDDSNNAAAVASRAWMSIGAAGGFKQVRDNPAPKSQISADSLYNPAREFQPQMTRAWGEFRAGSNQLLQSEKSNFPMQAFVPQATHVPNEQHLQNRSMIYPQLVQADMSKFNLHSNWRALSPHNQPRKKQEMLPPDLNIGFQSPGSPVKQSSNVLVDSQQPDLALQL